MKEKVKNQRRSKEHRSQNSNYIETFHENTTKQKNEQYFDNKANKRSSKMYKEIQW